MIIFNINAGFCVALIWALAQGLRYVFPSMTTAMETCLVALLFTSIGGCAEKLDLRPRIFFTPLWFVGVILVFRAIYIFAGQLVFWPVILLSLSGVGFYLYDRKKKMARRRLPVTVEGAEAGNQ